MPAPDTLAPYARAASAAPVQVLGLVMDAAAASKLGGFRHGRRLTGAVYRATGAAPTGSHR